MDQEEIKKSLRHSFTSAQPEEEVKISKNQFGHTVLGESKPHDTSMHTFEYDESGALKASFDFRDLADHPELQKFQKVITPDPEPVPEPERKILSVAHDISRLISELDDMDGTSKKKIEQTLEKNESETKTECFKNCLNKDCMYNLPKEAKFCLKCGTPQMPKFCTECGYSFPGMEKFCPDCGNKR
jgi:DNA polymerase II large subunit